MVNLAGETVRGKPFDYCIGIKKRLINSLRFGTEYPVKSDGVCGHGNFSFGLRACYGSVASGIGLPADDKRIADKPAHSISMPLSFHSYCLVMAISQVNIWLAGVEVLRYNEHLQWLRKQ
jgi:hypothetical protein